MKLVADGTIRQSETGPFDPTHLAGPVFSRRFTAQRHDGRWVILTDWYAVVDLHMVFPGYPIDSCHTFDVNEQVVMVIADNPDGTGNVQDCSPPDEFPAFEGFATAIDAAVYAHHCAEISSADFFRYAQRETA